jgi:Phage Terminase
MSEPYEVLCGLALTEDGQTWGEITADWQHHDARAVIDGRRCFEVRPRGASKTTDAAALTLALLVTQAPTRSRSYLYAVDEDQAAELLDIIDGIVDWTPGLSGMVKLERNRLTVTRTGATLRVEASDAASAFSKRPWLVVVDELTSWPDSTNHRRLWAAIASAMPKQKGSRLLVLSMAGSPVHFSRKIWQTAQDSPDWYSSAIPGPCPWWNPADTEATRALLTESEFRRYVLAEWVETDEALGTEGDVLACVRSGPSVLEPRERVRYVAALDVGTRRDMTALAVCHAEPSPLGRRVVVDRVIYWRPTAARRVDLAEVQATTERVCREYRAPLRFDRSQAEQLSQNLTRAGVKVEEYVFSQAGANRLAKSLYVALRDRTLSIPDEPELISELQSARLIETAPGMVKMINPPGHHDDLAVSVGMCLVHLAEHPTDRPGRYGGLAMARSILSEELDLNSARVAARDAFNPWRGTSPFAERLG